MRRLFVVLVAALVVVGCGASADPRDLTPPGPCPQGEVCKDEPPAVVLDESAAAPIVTAPAGSVARATRGAAVLRSRPSP